MLPSRGSLPCRTWRPRAAFPAFPRSRSSSDCCPLTRPMASKKVEKKEEEDAPKTVALDAGDLKLLQTYGVGPYTRAIKTLESGITEEMKKIVDLIGELPLPCPLPPPLCLLGRCRGGKSGLACLARPLTPPSPPPPYARSPVTRPCRREGERHWPGAALHVGPARGRGDDEVRGLPAGGAVHQDHQCWAGRRQVHGQCAPVRQVRGEAGGEGEPHGH